MDKRGKISIRRKARVMGENLTSRSWCPDSEPIMQRERKSVLKLRGHRDLLHCTIDLSTGFL